MAIVGAQKHAIEKTSGPCMIMAGAGTGKTFTVVEKIANLINTNVCQPSEILCLTFSNEATNNIVTEVEKKIGNSLDITIRTFHGFCADILKEFGERINVDPGFEILLPDDAKIMFHKYLEISPYYSNRYVASISSAKDFGISETDIEKHVEKLKQELIQKIGTENFEEEAKKLDLELKTLHLQPSETVDERRQIRERKKQITEILSVYQNYKKFESFIDAWKKYNNLKQEKNYQDYSDLIFNTIELFNKFGAHEVANRYKYVIIDEFQDTNKLQFELIEYLAGDHRNITVVGDPNQSIYAFRGAYRESFNHFKEAFKVNEKTDIFNLDKSYRSPNTILKVSHDLIQNNYEDPAKCFLVTSADNREGDKVAVVELKNQDEEARKIAEIVEEEIESGTSLDQICILYRTHKQSRAIRNALEAKKIPIVSAGETDMLQKAEIRTAVSYLSILNNLLERTGTGEQAWWNLFHYHNALTPIDSIKIGRFLKKKRNEDVSIDLAVMESIKDIGLSEDGQKIIQRIVKKLETIMKSSSKPLPELILDIYEIVGLNRAFSTQRSIENIESLMNLKNFYDLAESYYTTHDKDLSSFIKYLEILEQLGVNIPASKISNVNAVRLMTIHAAKGLQFDTVIVSNLATDRFPVTRTRGEPLIPKELLPDLKRHMDSLGEISEQQKIDAIKKYEADVLLREERRLCYVGFTRAKNKLILTYARSYNKEENSTTPSIFLSEVKFQENQNMEFCIDKDEKCTVLAPCSKFEKFKQELKNQLINSLDSDDLDSLLSRIILYQSVRDGKIKDLSKIKLDKVISKNELEKNIKINNERCSCVDFDRDNFTFSPTALITYDECPKKYELSKIYQMPQRGEFEWNGASTGSFVHELFEEGVKSNFNTKKQFVELALEMSKTPDWDGVDLDDVNSLIDVFWERHNGKYNEKSLVEQKFNFKLEGFRFFGIADRIDFITDDKIEIIDYKTNRYAIDTKKRSWQLGFYAIAAKECLGLNIVKLTLEMLRLEKPLTGEVDADGNVKAGRAKGFNIEDIKKELIECARNIVRDYEGEFLPTEDEDKCRRCGYKFYCPKWNA